MDSVEHEVDPSGDLTLLVGLGPSMKIRVSSKVLTIASRVFKVMFYGGFSESLGNSASTTSRTVKLPDDEPETILILCNLLHYRYGPWDELPCNVEGLYKLAVACDKYDCTKAAYFCMRTSLSRMAAAQHLHPNRAEMVTILQTCFIVQDREIFTDVTRQILLTWDENDIDKAAADSEDQDVNTVMQEIGNRTSTLRDTVLRTLYSPIYDPLAVEDEDYVQNRTVDPEQLTYLRPRTPCCPFQAYLTHTYIRALRRTDLNSVSRRTNWAHISQSLKNLGKINLNNVISPSKRFCGPHQDKDVGIDLKKMTQSLRTAIDGNMEGLCLGCVLLKDEICLPDCNGLHRRKAIERVKL